MVHFPLSWESFDPFNLLGAALCRSLQRALFLFNTTFFQLTLYINIKNHRVNEWKIILKKKVMPIICGMTFSFKKTVVNLTILFSPS